MPDSTLARKYQAEWADVIQAQGRDPFARFPVATFKARKLPKRPRFQAIKFARLHPSAFVPLDAERDYTPRLHTNSYDELAGRRSSRELRRAA